MDTSSQIQQQIKEHPVILYMKGSPKLPQCGFSALAVEKLEQCGARFAYVNILENPEIRKTLPQISNWPTFPQLYINGELIGGSDIIAELYQQGELERLLKSVETTG